MSWTTTTKKTKLYQITGENTRDLMHPETSADMVTVKTAGLTRYRGNATDVQGALEETYDLAKQGGDLSNDIAVIEFDSVINTVTMDTYMLMYSKPLCVVRMPNPFGNGVDANVVTLYKIRRHSNVDRHLIEFVYMDDIHTRYTMAVTYTGSGSPSVAFHGQTQTQPTVRISPYADDDHVPTEKAVRTELDKKLDAAPNGTDALISNGKIATTYIPDSILGQLVFGGTVTGAGIATLTPNAKSKLVTTSDSLTLTNNNSAGTGYGSNIGIFYVVSSDGNFASLGLKTGDWLLSLGTKWDKVDNTDEVTSVNGSTGNVTLYASNLPLSALDNTTILSAIGSRVEANTAITAGTATKITYDSKGLVTGGTGLTSSDIPSLDTSKITSGTFADARIASAAAWNAMATAVSTGSGTHSVVTVNNQGIVTGGGHLIEIGSKADLTNTPSNDLVIGGLFFEEV